MKCFLKISTSLVIVMTSLSISTKPLSLVAEDLTAYSEVWNLIKIYRPNYVELDPDLIQQSLIHRNVLYARMEMSRSNKDLNSVRNGRVVANLPEGECDPYGTRANDIDCPLYSEIQTEDASLYNVGAENDNHAIRRSYLSNDSNSQDHAEYLINKKMRVYGKIILHLTQERYLGL